MTAWNMSTLPVAEESAYRPRASEGAQREVLSSQEASALLKSRVRAREGRSAVYFDCGHRRREARGVDLIWVRFLVRGGCGG